ncbi:MAG: serine/threonine-protein kinase PknH/PknJ [Mycobacterium sp.]|uniref:serine/threonine-protein kinase PknH/PknJ n=1 Tax=Mycobacterium sp. TaxID=1785 RepID=UPI003BAF4F60
MDGTPFGRYRLVELLGRGGMGEVWRAHDTDTDRIVAVKVLPTHLSEDEEFQRRFRREAHAAARLNNPHVIPIHNYGEIDGRLYVDMRLIEGRDLETVLADGPLDPARAVRIIDQVARALHAAHKVGLIHRDIKPSNILLDADDFAYLIDFGIARAIDETRMTKSGNTIGTFAYIAPERLDARAEEDGRADIYSLACVLYECLTGQPPFPGDSMAHLVTAHLTTPPPRPSTAQPNVPSGVDNVIATGMAKDPNHRYATTIELADAARDAITDPIGRPTPTPTQPPTEQTSSPVPPAAVTKYRQPQPAHSPWSPPAITYPSEPLAPGMAGFGSERQTAEPVPRPQRQRRVGVIAAVVATVVVLASGIIGITGYLLLKDRHPAETPTAQPAPPQPAPHSSPASSTLQAPPPPPSALNGLLLSPDQINTAMGTTDMSSVGTMTTMPDNSFAVSDQACLPLSAAAEAKVYAGSGYTAVRAQVVAKAQQNAVNQAVVLFSSAQDAGSFFTASAEGWQACSNHQFTLTANGNSQVNTVGPVSNTNGTLSATVTPANSLGACERALTVANNVAIDVTACLGPQGAAANIAHQIAAKVGR